MHLKEMAEEDIYFARHDRELIEALHRKRIAEPRLRKIVSGGQTGADRAALDVALEVGIAVGGWCPRGRRALDGPLPARYPLTETPSADYAQRTEWNVRDSDATLILHRGPLSGGTLFTAEMAAKHGRPLLRVDLDVPVEPEAVASWLNQQGVIVLNLAGPREENAPGIYLQAKAFLRRLLTPLATPTQHPETER
jgi:hypothetical protein